MIRILFLFFFFPLLLSAQEEAKEKELFNFSFDDAPTYIRSNTLELFPDKNFFEYTGDVELLHGDMTITAETLKGNYTDENEIQNMVAEKNVIITRGENVKSQSEVATYDAQTEQLLLTVNPSLQQGRSVVTADKITLFLAEDRSHAEGDVRVKLVEEETESAS